MMHAIALAACVLACGVGYRIRGGALAGTRFQLPGQVSRLTFALAASATALAAGVPWWLALLLVPAWFVGTTLPLFGAIDLGRNEGTFWGDFCLLALRGLLGVLLPAIALGAAGYGWLALLGAGPMMAPAYVAARAIRWAPRLPNNALGTAVDFPPRGELITGALFGLGTVLAIAW